MGEITGVAEMTDCDKCCGFGGSYSIKYPEISAEVLKIGVENIRAAVTRPLRSTASVATCRSKGTGNGRE